jgi:Protein of unknown function (DUF3006)
MVRHHVVAGTSTCPWGTSTVKFQLSLDRFEGDKQQVAVLLTDDGDQINFPKGLLPKGLKAGDIFSVTIEKDAQTTGKVADQTHIVQADLKKTDPGGDIKA